MPASAALARHGARGRAPPRQRDGRAAGRRRRRAAHPRARLDRAARRPHPRVALAARAGSPRMLAPLGRWTGGPVGLLVLEARERVAARPAPAPPQRRAWVNAERVRLVRTRYRVEIDLSERRVTVLRAGRVVRRFRAVVGAPARPRRRAASRSTSAPASPTRAASSARSRSTSRPTATCSTTTAAVRAGSRSTGAEARACSTRWARRLARLRPRRQCGHPLPRAGAGPGGAGRRRVLDSPPDVARGPHSYDPGESEERVFARWLESGRFHPEPEGRRRRTTRSRSRRRTSPARCTWGTRSTARCRTR